MVGAEKMTKRTENDTTADAMESIDGNRNRRRSETFAIKTHGNVSVAREKPAASATDDKLNKKQRGVEGGQWRSSPLPPWRLPKEHAGRPSPPQLESGTACGGSLVYWHRFQSQQTSVPFDWLSLVIGPLMIRSSLPLLAPWRGFIPISMPH